MSGVRMTNAQMGSRVQRFVSYSYCEDKKVVFVRPTLLVRFSIPEGRVVPNLMANQLNVALNCPGPIKGRAEANILHLQ